MEKYKKCIIKRSVSNEKKFFIWDIDEKVEYSYIYGGELKSFQCKDKNNSLYFRFEDEKEFIYDIDILRFTKDPKIYIISKFPEILL